jgi:hypothetical protein
MEKVGEFEGWSTLKFTLFYITFLLPSRDAAMGKDTYNPV